MSRAHAMQGEKVYFFKGDIGVVTSRGMKRKHAAEHRLPVHGGARGGERLRVRICACIVCWPVRERKGWGMRRAYVMAWMNASQ